MNKSLKILVISLISLFFIFATNCLAVNIDMNLTADLADSNTVTTDSNNIATQYNTTSNNSSTGNSSNAISNETVVQNASNTVFGGTSAGSSSNDGSLESTAGTSTTNRNTGVADVLQSLPEAELGLTNVLNILLIAVGVVLILLAIAIFIRLKK